ncbi:MAG: type II toxin-antitoxin system RelE/ParE family toxin [Hyphomicrobiaceae bacterium]|nr:type II toxin-antitoxin system RelE/ParE family toxin [Hyphomicrobiaceae bacterium]
MGFRLTAKAEEDILRIFAEGAERFGIMRAEAYHLELAALFDLIAANPQIALERHEIAPPVRIHPHKSHLIVYLTDPDGGVLIVRIRHGQEDWESDPV